MKKLFALIIIISLALTGCTVLPPGSVAQYRSNSQYSVMVRTGTLEAVRMIKVQGSPSGAGMLAGGVVGGLVGSKMGGGRGKKILTVLGAIAGAGVGANMEQNSSASRALELIIRMDNGEVVAIVQELSEEAFYNGQRVRVVNDNGQLWVSRF